MKEVKAIESLGELYEVFGDLVPEKLLGLEPKGANSRDRALPPRVTFWAFVWQALNPASSCREVTRKIEAWWRWMQRDRSGQGLLSASAYCQARQRLEAETLELILGHTAHNLERHVLQEELGPQKRRVRILDGTGLSARTRWRTRPSGRSPRSKRLGSGSREPVRKFVCGSKPERKGK